MSASLHIRLVLQSHGIAYNFYGARLEVSNIAGRYGGNQ